MQRKQVRWLTRGQTLIELVIVSAVAIIIIGALTFATIASLRNATFAKNQTQATKLAQDGIEQVRGLRDRNLEINGSLIDETVTKFNDLWGFRLYNYCSTTAGTCYFMFDGSKKFSYVTLGSGEQIDDVEGDTKFKRYFKLTDKADCPDVSSTNCFEFQKDITAVVEWTDFAGLHQSELTTTLRNLIK